MRYLEARRPRQRRREQSFALTIPPGGSASTGAITILAFGGVVTVTASNGAGRLLIKVRHGSAPVAGHAFGFYIDGTGTHSGAFLDLAAASTFFFGPEQVPISGIEVEAVGTTADVSVVVAVAEPPDWEG